MIWTFLYFIFPSSAVLFYGLGTSRAIIISDELSEQTLRSVKTLLSVVSSSVLTFLFANSVLAPVNLSDFYPLVALLIFLSISILIEVIIRITTKSPASEFTVSFLAILLSVGEASNLPEAIFISLSCLVSFYILSYLIKIIKRRVSIASTPTSMTNSSLIFLTMAILMIILYFTNVSFLNPGVLK